MKLEPRSVEAFLNNPSSVRIVLLYGDDLGLIRARANRLVRSVAGSLDDPFRVVEADAAPSLPSEMASLPLSGGRRVVRLREATDAAMGAVQQILAGSSTGFLIVEGSGLPTRSKLRTLVESAPEAAAIGCYAPDVRTLGANIRTGLSAASVTADPEALEWLVGHLGADHAATESEIAKLACYAGAGGRIDVAMARLCVGDMAGLSLDDALFAATSGDTAGADRALALALSEGAAPVGVLRAGLLHLQRLTRARLAVAFGAEPGEAMRGARPPVFFRQQPAFRLALRLWSPAMLAWANTSCVDAEQACKRTGAPAEVICRHTVARIALRGAALRRDMS